MWLFTSTSMEMTPPMLATYGSVVVFITLSRTFAESLKYDGRGIVPQMHYDDGSRRVRGKGGRQATISEV